MNRTSRRIVTIVSTIGLVIGTIGLAQPAQSLSIADDTGSARTMHGLAEIDTALTPWRTLPRVGEFRAAPDAILLLDVLPAVNDRDSHCYATLGGRAR